VPTLLVEVTQAQEVVVAAKAACDAAVLVAETSARKATAAQDSAAFRVKDADGWATLAEREPLERVSRVEAEATAALASAR
jgi:hypothetical protein